MHLYQVSALFIVAAVVTVTAEQCTVNGDCKSTNCGQDFHVVCQHPPNTGVTTNGGLCTCAVNNLTCTSQAQCQAYQVSYYTCISDGHKHCYDGKCICTRW